MFVRFGYEIGIRCPQPTPTMPLIFPSPAKSALTSGASVAP